jgi:TorA maturation chaperone TorD
VVRCTAEERSLARAAAYRLLALAFSYPTPEVRAALPGAIEVARVAAELTDGATAAKVEEFADALARDGDAGLEAAFQRVFTLSYSEDCPPYETAFSSSHIFQQTQEQADIVGFYRAFGVDPESERPDHIALELEYCYLLALKEAHARELGEADHIRICRDAQRAFLRDHLARWAQLIGQRVAVTDSGGVYGAIGELLVAFVNWDERFLRVGRVRRYRDEPVLIADDPGDMTCPAEDLASAEVANLPFFESREEADSVLATSS